MVNIENLNQKNKFIKGLNNIIIITNLYAMFIIITNYIMQCYLLY